MYANVRIIVESKPDALILPPMHSWSRNPHIVFTIADSKAKRVTVKTGFNDAGVAEILEGLKPDDAVILVGKQVLTMGNR